MFAASLITGLFAGSSTGNKDEKKSIELQQKRVEEQRDAAQKTVDDRRQQMDSEGHGGEGAENGEKGPGGDKPAAAAEDDGLMSRDMFIKIEKRREKYLQDLEAEDEGVEGHKSHVPRRWAVRIWNIQLESLIKEDATVFLNLSWAGDRQEARIRTKEGVAWWDVMGEPEVVWGMGEDPLCMRSDVMLVKEKTRINFRNEFSFEWQGSYAELESQQLVIELWRFNKFRANTLDSLTKDSLVSYATGPVFKEVELVKAVPLGGVDESMKDDAVQQSTRFKISFQIYFQELYDFELNFIDMQGFGLMSYEELSRAGPREFAKHFRDQSKTGPSVGGGLQSEMGSVGGAIATNRVGSLFEESENDEEEEIDDTGNDGPPSVGPPSLVTGSTMDLLSSGPTGPSVLRRAGTRMDITEQRRLAKKLNPETSKKKSKIRRKFIGLIENPTWGDQMRRGTMEVKSDLRKMESDQCRWDNIGKIYYRGTLADLDNDSLRLRFYESSGSIVDAAAVLTLIANATVSLRGVHEYGTISGACVPPQWVVDKAVKGGKSVEEIKMIKKSSIGSFEAKIVVDNIPKYKQSGELCDMLVDKAYLLVKVLRVDRLAIPDQRPINQCDSAVQVQFSGNSYETEVRQDTISPQFDQEFYFEMKTDTPSDFSPQELAAMHGPIVFDVWLRSDDEGAVTAEHVGHAQCSLLDIFAEGKPEMKTHNSIRTGEISEYKTAVLKARKRLTCLWTPGVVSSSTFTSANVPSSALAPSYLYVDIWLRPFDFLTMNHRTTGGAVAMVKAGTLGMSSATLMTQRSLINLSGSDKIAKDAHLPPAVASELGGRAKAWETQTQLLSRKYGGVKNRYFDFVATSQDREEHLLPMFLDVIRPPEMIYNPKAIAFWVHCLSHTTMEDLKAAVPFWSTPDFTLSLGKGDTFAHALLHCSLLRGLPGSSDGIGGSTVFGSSSGGQKNAPGRPFVCLGTTWDEEQIAWVVTLHETGTVRVWDTANNRQFELPNRCADIVRCEKVVNSVRFPGHLIQSSQLEAEVRRRQRLVKQEINLQKMKRIDHNVFECDEKIFRAPELLKLYETKVHPHALVFSSNVNPSCTCYDCGSRPGNRMLYGFVCNKILVANERPDDGGDESLGCGLGDKKFLCLTCAKKSYPAEGPLPRKRDGTIDVALSPVKFMQAPILPYKSIDVIFDQTNIWLNLQHFCPATIYYDLWNPMYWHPFTTCATHFRPFTNASKGLRKAKSMEYFGNIRNRILTKLKQKIVQIRRNANMSTYIQRDALLEEHLNTGMELLFRRELMTPGSAESSVSDGQIAEWKMELYSKVPSKHRLVGNTFLFSFFDSIEISRIVCEKLDFVNFKETGTQFVIASYIGKLPNSVTACYVYVGVVFPLSDFALTQVVDLRAKDQSVNFRQDNAASSTSPFTDEIIEQQRLFTQRTQIFDSDTEFIARMKQELYRRDAGDSVVSGGGASASLALKQNNNSRPPIKSNGTFIRSHVDYPRDAASIARDKDDDDVHEDDPLLDQEEVSENAQDDPNNEQSSAGFMNTLVADGVAAGTQATDYLAGLFNGTIPFGLKPGQGSNDRGPPNDVRPQEEVSPTNQVSQLTNFFSKPSPPSETTAVSYLTNFLTGNGPATNPTPHNPYTHPSEQDLNEIYKPRTIQRPLGHRQFLRHVPSGFSVPIPSQQRMKEAVELGAGDLTAKVHVTAAQEKVVIQKVTKKQ